MTLESKHLRIGNYISQGGEIVTVEHISRSIDDWDRTNHKRTQDCEPIQLTEEWLLKFGLKPDVWFYETSFCIVEDKDWDQHYGWCMKVRNASHTKEIEFGYFKYVHELQNLYSALTGEELVIKKEEIPLASKTL